MMRSIPARRCILKFELLTSGSQLRSQSPRTGRWSRSPIRLSVDPSMCVVDLLGGGRVCGAQRFVVCVTDPQRIEHRGQLPGYGNDSPLLRVCTATLAERELSSGCSAGRSASGSTGTALRANAAVEQRGTRSPTDFVAPRTWLISCVRERTKHSRARSNARSCCASGPRCWIGCRIRCDSPRTGTTRRVAVWFDSMVAGSVRLRSFS